MKKRIRKKANKAIEGKIAQLHEIGRELMKLHLYGIDINESYITDGITIKAMINVEDLLKLPFVKKDEIKITDRQEASYPYEASFIFQDMRFYSLLNLEDYVKCFPERIDSHVDYIEIAGNIYKKIGF